MGTDSDTWNLPPVKFEAFGTVTPPDGMTQDDADRLAREADEARKADR